MRNSEDIYYDKTYEIGESIINIVAPKISKEERAERIEEIKRVILLLYREINMARN
jgi:hypothetical protein